MKRLCLLMGLFLCVVNGKAQEIPLPVFKNEKWGIVQQGKTIDLGQRYTYVNYFDDCELAWVQAGKYYGVINAQGREIVKPAYFDIRMRRNGVFQVKNDSGWFFLKIRGEEITLLPFTQIREMSENWMQLVIKGQTFYYNTAVDTLFVNDSINQYYFYFNHMLCYHGDSSYSFFDDQAQLIFRGKGSYVANYYFFRFMTDEDDVVVDDYGAWQFPRQSDNREAGYEYLHYRLGNRAYVLNRAGRKVVFSYPCDALKPVYEGYEFRRNGKTGLLSKEGKVLLPAIYDYFSLGKPYTYVYNNGLAGLIDSNYREVVPCKYREIGWDAEFFYTTSLSGYKGLHSRKFKHEILPAVYDDFTFKNKLIKARMGKNLMIYELDQRHRVKDKLALGNVLGVHNRTFGSARREYRNFDPRLFTLGWFVDSSQRNGQTTYRLGIRNTRDSIILKPRYRDVFFIPKSNFSLILEKLNDPSQLDLQKSKGYQYPITEASFVLVDYMSGRRFKLPHLQHVDTLDLLTRNFTRFRDTNSYGIITSNDVIHRYRYMDLHPSKYVRYCHADKERPGLLNEPQYVALFPMQLNSNYQAGSRTRSCFFDQWGKAGSPRGLVYTKATWNFLTPEGDSLFEKGFDFAEPFYLGTSLVERAGLWGVIRDDSLFVPTAYHVLKRLKNYGDTFYLAGLSQGKQMFYDSLLQPLDLHGYQFVKAHGKLLQFTKGKKQVMADQNGKILLESDKAIRFHAFDRVVVRDKKMYVIYDALGQVIGEVASKPEEFVSPDHFLLEHNGKLGLSSLHGDTIIPPVYRSIVPFGNEAFLASGASATAIYMDDGSKLVEQAGTLLCDSIQGTWAVQAKGKMLLYQAGQKKAVKIKSPDIAFQWYHNGWFFARRENWAMDEQGLRHDLPERIAEVIGLTDGYTALRTMDDYLLIYDDDWHRVAAEIAGIRKVEYLGSGVFAFRASAGFTLYQINGHVATTQFCEVIPDEGCKRLLVKYNQGICPYVFIDTQFKPISKWQFSRAHAFVGDLAPVGDDRGWTLYSERGTQVTYPNFNELEFLGNNLLVAKPKMQYGILNEQGKFIIEPLYENLIFITDHIIRGIRDGQIFYFDKSGRVLFQ